MKASFLIFDTDFSVEMKKANVKDGKVTIGNKEWSIDKARPLMLSGFPQRPLYFMKWDNLIPLDWNVMEEVVEKNGRQYIREQLVPLGEDDLKWQTKYRKLPELLKETQDMRFMKHMKRYAGGEGIFSGDRGRKMTMFLVFAIIFGIVGFAITYLMQSGAIKF